jgi:sulfur-oxidizing protein SoxZ
MAKGIKIRATAKGDSTTVKALMSHNMETGLRKDKKTGNKIPAHFIQEVTCEHNGKSVLTALWGPAVSKNPYLSFKFKGGAKGDTVKISWVDNKGESASGEAKIG